MTVILKRFLAIALLCSVFAILTAPLVIAQSPSSNPVCTSSVQVNDDAFGLPAIADDYKSEEGFEVLVFNDQLYVGMEADNTLGARLWRTKTYDMVPHDWEEVIAEITDEGDICPFGNCTKQDSLFQNDHIDSLAEFNNNIYASTANGGSTTQGTQVWRSPSGDKGSWTQVNTNGFGTVNNTNFKDMQVFDGQLCGGTQNGNSGAQVWCTQDGTNWEQKNASGFGDWHNIGIWSGYVYNNALYFGVHNNVAKLFRTIDLDATPASWIEVYTGSSGSVRVEILGDLNGYLYISDRSSNGIRILRSPSGNSGTWVQVNIPGMDGNPNNARAVVDSATIYNDGLYVGISDANATAVKPVEVWRTTGALQNGGPLVDWIQVGTGGLTDPKNVYTQLIPFNEHLYAWTSNYVTGQQVLRTDCVSLSSNPDTPLTPETINIEMSDNDVRLTWPHVTPNMRYQVWRSTTPYFTVSTSEAEALVETLAPLTATNVIFQDAGTIGDHIAYFYAIRATNGGASVSALSAEVGKFEFELTPGTN